MTNKKIAFLTHLAVTGNVSASAAYAELSRSQAYEWRKSDEDFAASWDEALTIADEHQVKPIYQAMDQAIDKMNQNQISINRIESASDHFWKSGWRPAAGWICITALGWHYLIEPVLASCLTMFGMTLPPLPRADFNDLWTLLLALLGMSGLRSIDKTRQNNPLNTPPNTGPAKDTQR